MYRLEDRNAELAVISNDLINICIREDNDTLNRAAMNDHDDNIEFPSVRSLSLSFKKIFKIDNLVTLDNLISLKLDNNVIQVIENISHLRNLTWLDLSFNNISEIQGLETLTQLTDLSLFNNKISNLKNMETLTKLQVFSIGNNCLQTTESLLYLRCLDNLRVLNLEGNPVCADPEYKSFVLAHIDKLKYLDYAFIDKNEVILAREQYQDELEEYKEIKAIEYASKATEKENEEYAARLRDANLSIIETLLSDMFKEDMDIAKLQILPGLQNLIDDYTDKVKTATDNVKVVLLEKQAKMTKEHTDFSTALLTLQEKSQEKSIEKVERYQKNAKAILKQATFSNEPVLKEQLLKLQQENENLIYELMNIETELTEQSSNFIDILETHQEAMNNERKDIGTEHFRVIEEFENHYFEGVLHIANVLLERIAGDEMEEDDILSDECKSILNDRELLNNAISGSHDIHIGKLLAQEDAMREEGTRRVQQMIHAARNSEMERNRERISEILHLKERNLHAIHDLKEQISRMEEECDA